LQQQLHALWRDFQKEKETKTMTTMTTITDLPLAKLVPGKRNVRKTATGSLDALIASIRAHGLIQNLTVRPVLNKKGSPTGRYEVIAGNRRLAALKALAEAGEIASNTALPCHVLDTGDDTEIGLAENTIREAMHPADQFEAFHAMAEAGTGIEDIAARFGVTALFVRQRLKLARVSPVLFEAYRQGEMTLDHLMAFTITQDHAEQEKVWNALPNWNRHPGTIRRALTMEAIPSDDRRVCLIGLETYEAAGGTVQRDLFDSAEGGYLTDPALLDRLVAERLETEAERLTTEGWAWTRVVPDLDHRAFDGLVRSYPAQMDLSEEDQAALDTAIEAYDTLAEQHDETPDEPEIAAEIDRLSDEIDRLTALQQVWTDQIKASHGCLIGIHWDGTLRIEAGWRERHETPAPANDGEPETDTGDEAPAPSRKLSPKLTAELIAHRTAALRAEVMQRPDIALVLTVHKLALQHFYRDGLTSSLDLRGASEDLTRHGDTLSDNPGTGAMAEAQGRWQLRLPSEASDLWDRLLGYADTDLMNLLAFLTATSLEPAFESSRSKRHADQLAETLDLDMTRYWRATPETFFGKVTKSTILDAVRESVSEAAAENLASLKKDALIDHATARMAETDWLPDALRRPADPDTALAA
tara:strand:+ start:767 stop:2692 length:1926 start_codon:yes stop_codon:yes gene_type:complete